MAPVIGTWEGLPSPEIIGAEFKGLFKGVEFRGVGFVGGGKLGFAEGAVKFDAVGVELDGLLEKVDGGVEVFPSSRASREEAKRARASTRAGAHPGAWPDGGCGSSAGREIWSSVRRRFGVGQRSAGPGGRGPGAEPGIGWRRWHTPRR